MSDVALATVVCTYVFTLLATISLSIHAYYRLMVRHEVEAEDFLTLIAFIVSLALVGQITWAVIDEGQGEHMSDVTGSQFEHAAKVVNSLSL